MLVKIDLNKKFNKLCRIHENKFVSENKFTKNNFIRNYRKST